MSLYDDLDSRQPSDQIEGWSSGIKLLQQQLVAKKTSAAANTARPSLGHKDSFPRKSGTFNPTGGRNEESVSYRTLPIHSPLFPVTPQNSIASEYSWDVVDEYDPMWPNEYEKLLKEKRDKNKEREEKRRESSSSSSAKRHRKSDDSPKYSGFAGRPSSDDEETPASTKSSRSSTGGGAAIAPPPSLQESVAIINEPKNPIPGISNNYGTSSVAAKIMQKYGFKDGQGLGKKEQGMAMALQVEKTSKRGGRIIHEKELMGPPGLNPTPTASSPPSSSSSTPVVDAPEPSITEIMKSPSKVVLLRNMVGPGDVDNDLEPEVKDECNTKYGDVIKVIIHEIKSIPEESVRIFVEFKRIESAIKAVVDLNGRFFGGRQVRAGFYNLEKFHNLELL